MMLINEANNILLADVSVITAQVEDKEWERRNSNEVQESTCKCKTHVHCTQIF